MTVETCTRRYQRFSNSPLEQSLQFDVSLVLSPPPYGGLKCNTATFTRLRVKLFFSCLVVRNTKSVGDSDSNEYP